MLVGNVVEDLIVEAPIPKVAVLFQLGDDVIGGFVYQGAYVLDRGGRLILAEDEGG